MKKYLLDLLEALLIRNIHGGKKLKTRQRILISDNRRDRRNFPNWASSTGNFPWPTNTRKFGNWRSPKNILF